MSLCRVKLSLVVAVLVINYLVVLQTLNEYQYFTMLDGKIVAFSQSVFVDATCIKMEMLLPEKSVC